MNRGYLRSGCRLGLLLLLALGACKSQGKKGVSQDKVAQSPNTARVDDAGPLDAAAGPIVLKPAPEIPEAPLGLPPTPSPEYNPTTPEKVALGALLFHDPILSSGASMSCASCHQAEKGWSSAEAADSTSGGKLNQRHTPTLWNTAYHEQYYWDGRAEPLESHVLGHWQGQLGLPPKEAVAVLARSRFYLAHFQRSFGEQPSRDRAAEALAAFVRTRRNGASPWDKHEAGEAEAVSPEVVAGQKIFNQRAGCATCHPPPFYTDLGYHALTEAGRAASADPGRAAVSNRPEDRAAFKTPGLRGLLSTAPYFHDGSAKTLEEVLERKERSGSPRLSAQEKASLLLFLGSLSPRLPSYTAPTIPSNAASAGAPARAEPTSEAPETEASDASNAPQ